MVSLKDLLFKDANISEFISIVPSQSPIKDFLEAYQILFKFLWKSQMLRKRNFEELIVRWNKN